MPCTLGPRKFLGRLGPDRTIERLIGSLETRSFPRMLPAEFGRSPIGVGRGSERWGPAP